MRALLQQSGAGAGSEASALEAAVQSATVDNLELGCASSRRRLRPRLSAISTNRSPPSRWFARSIANPASTNRSSTRPSCRVGTRLPSRSRSDRDRASFRVPLFAFTTTLRSFRARRLVRRRPLARHRRLLDSRSVSRTAAASGGVSGYAAAATAGCAAAITTGWSRGEGATEGAQEVGKDTAASKVPPSSGGAQGQPDPAGLREKVAAHFDEWARVQDLPPTDAASVAFMQRLVDSRLLAEDTQERFLRILVELAVTHCLGSEVPSSTPQASSQLSFAAIDAYVRLVTRLVRRKEETLASRLAFFGRALVAVVRTAMRDTDERNVAFNARPYFRALAGLLNEMYAPDNSLDSSHPQVLAAFASAFLALQPLRVPGFAFAWLELVSHRCFMPRLLIDHEQKGWPLLQRLLTAILRFMEPHLRTADLSEPIKLLYKGMLRLFLVLLHDFPEFLCNHHVNFCDIIPPNCIQLRNLVLSAYPRNMRLPDPFTPNLKVDLLPEIQQPPRLNADADHTLRSSPLREEVDTFLKTRSPKT